MFDHLTPVRRCLSNDGAGDAANLVRIRRMQPGSKSGCRNGKCVPGPDWCVCVCCMLSPDFDLRDGDDDSQVWGRRPSNLETELQQLQDVSNPAYPTTDLRRWL